jgi:hypothetical protein
MRGRRLIHELMDNDGIWDSTGQMKTSLPQRMRSAMERPVRREASRLLLDAAAGLSRGDGIGVKLVEEVNRRLAVLGSISDGSRSAFPEGLEEIMGELYDLFLLMWEAQMRVHRGLPRGGR